MNIKKYDQWKEGMMTFYLKVMFRPSNRNVKTPEQFVSEITLFAYSEHEARRMVMEDLLVRSFFVSKLINDSPSERYKHRKKGN